MAPTKTYCNIDMLSFLLASFNNVIETFGSNKKSVDFYRGQVENLLDIGQVDNNSVEIINELINYSYVTDNEKWNIELKKVAFFTSVMDIILTNAKNVDGVEGIVFRIENSSETTKEQKKVLGIIRKIFLLKNKTPDEIKMTGGSHFGTMQFSGNKVKSGTAKYILGLAGSEAVVRVKNLEAYCCSDPAYHNYALNKELFNNAKSLKDIAKEFKRGAEVTVAKEVKTSDGCHTYRHYENIEEASVELRKFITTYSAK